MGTFAGLRLTRPITVDFAAVEKKALQLGAKAFVCENLQRELVDEVVKRAIQCNAVFESRYLLGTALARPVIARSQVRVAEKHGCQYCKKPTNVDAE